MLRTRPRPSASATEPRVRFRRTRRVYRSKGFAVFSALLLAVIALAGVWVAVWGDDPGDAPPAAVPSSAPSSTPAPAEPVPVGGGCPALPFEDQSLPAAAPAANWSPVGPSRGAAFAPSALDVGPVADEAGVARCFVRTPVGALFAAAGFLAGVSDPTSIEDTLEHRAVPGEGQQRLLLLYGFDPSAVFGGGGYEVAGFTFLSSGLDTVTVSVAVRAGNGGLAAVPVTVVWSDGTWLVRLPDDGDLTARSQLLPGLNGYTVWQAR
jgi:hypothetical protein